MNESPIPQSKLLPPTKGRRVLATRQSLDSAFTSSYRSGQESLQATTQATLEQEKRKAQEAKAYRQHLLNDRQQGYVSPDPTKPQTGHMAEIETEGKATFSQCVFNMANILMVREITLNYAGFRVIFSDTVAPIHRELDFWGCPLFL